MAARRDVNSPVVNSSQLCLDVNVDVSHINLHVLSSSRKEPGASVGQQKVQEYK